MLRIISKIRNFLRPAELDDVLREQKRLHEKLSLILDVLGDNDQMTDMRWLLSNRGERMDAMLPLFDEGRRRFHLERYEFAAKYAKEKKVADIACGTGYGSRLLSEKGRALNVVGVDVSEDAVTYARKKHSPKGVKFIVAPGEKSGLATAEYDLVVSFETIEHVEDADFLIEEFARILKPGGVLICSVPNQWPLEQTPHHVKEYDYSSFQDLLSEHFDVAGMFNQNSGSNVEFNRGQPAGIIETTNENKFLAECFIAVCRKATKE